MTYQRQEDLLQSWPFVTPYDAARFIFFLRRWCIELDGPFIMRLECGMVSIKYADPLPTGPRESPDAKDPNCPHILVDVEIRSQGLNVDNPQ